MEVEAISSELEGPRFNQEKRSRREFRPLGLGSKWKESNKKLTSPIVSVQITHWGFPSVCFFVCLGFRVCKMEIKCLLVRLLFCYDFRKLSTNFHSQQLSSDIDKF